MNHWNILKKRAERYHTKPEPKEKDYLYTVFVCRIDLHIYAFPINLIHELVPVQKWTPLPGKPPLIGITQVRGEVLTVFDFNDSFFKTVTKEKNWLLILKGKSGKIGIPVTECLGVEKISSEQLIPQDRWPIKKDCIADVTDEFWLIIDNDVMEKWCDQDV